MIEQKKESKFTRSAEVLPQNTRTSVIIKESEEINQVSQRSNWKSREYSKINVPQWAIIQIYNHFPSSKIIVERPAAERGERSQEERESGEEGQGAERSRAADEARRKEQMEQEKSKKLDGRMARNA